MMETTEDVLTPTAIDSMLVGSTVFAGGGGGTLSSARDASVTLTAPTSLISVGDVSLSNTIATVFVTGPVTDSNDPRNAISMALEIFQRTVGSVVKAFVPIEIGPECISDAMIAAELAGTPIVDADVMGFRASPELQLAPIALAEPESLFPMVACNSHNESTVVNDPADLREIDRMLRSINGASLSTQYVIAGQLNPVLLLKHAGLGSLREAAKLGNELCAASSKEELRQSLKQASFSLVGAGVIVEQSNHTDGGEFTSGTIRVGTNSTTFDALYKNEFVVLLKNKEVIATCPETITLFDPNARQSLCTGENNVGKEVWILVRAAIAPLRTAKACATFHPSVLGLPYEQVLVERMIK